MALILKKKENVVVKVDGQKVEVKPIIGYQDQLILTNVCVNKFNMDISANVLAIPACKVAFDLGVLALQTNIEVAGVKSNLKDEEKTLDINMNVDDIEYYTESGIFEKVFSKIENYEKVWNNVLFALQIISSRYNISQIGANLPTAEDLMKTISEMKNVINENKPFVEKVAEAKLANDFLVTESKELPDGVKPTKKTKKKE